MTILDRPRFAAALILTVAGTSPALAAEDRLYAMDGYAQNCALGSGAEGIIAVGAGRFSLTETRYERRSQLRAAADGWSSATYAIMSEGEPVSEETIRLRIDPQRAEIVDGAGRSFAGARCP